MKLSTGLFIEFMLSFRAILIYLSSYELQTATSARRQGIGKQLMEWMKLIGTKYKMSKVMLTCQKGAFDSKASG